MENLGSSEVGKVTEVRNLFSDDGGGQCRVMERQDIVGKGEGLGI